MKKSILLLLLISALLLTACSASRANSTGLPSGTQGGPGAGELSASLQIAIGTIKLDGTGNAVTAEQAKKLLPLWETLKVLESSDTAAAQEKQALIAQIQETMTAQQTQAITALNLSRQDMFALMQSQNGPTFGGTQNTNPQSGNSSNNNGRNFGGGGFAGGPPPDGGFGGGGFQGQGSTRTQSNSSTQNGNSNLQTVTDPNRIPTPLIQAVIEYLKKKTGA